MSEDIELPSGYRWRSERSGNGLVLKLQQHRWYGWRTVDRCFSGPKSIPAAAKHMARWYFYDQREREMSAAVVRKINEEGQ